MKRRLFFLLTLVSFACRLPASPTPPPNPKQTSSKSEKKGAAPTSNDVVQSANGWNYVKGEWVHPAGYKFVNGKVLRTTARLGKPLPTPPGKLALENPQKLTPVAAPVLDPSKVAAQKAAAERARNLAPRAAPQTGSNLF